MQRCFSSLGCAEFSLDDVLALARRHQIPTVELRALGGSLDLPAYFAAAFSAPAKLAEHVRAQDVRIVALDTSLKLSGSSEEDWRRTADNFLPWAEALGGVRLRVFDGGHSGDGAEIAEMAARVAWWQALRRERGWKTDLMVETHDSLFTAAAVRALLAAAPGTPILWDSHHTWKRGGEDPLVTWQALAPAVVHVHVKDSVSRPSKDHPYSYVPPGEGEFPAAPILAELRRSFAGSVCLEWERHWHPYLSSLESALESAQQHGWW